MRFQPRPPFYRGRVLAFGLTLAVLAGLGLAGPLRPGYSDFEKRSLAQFPAFSTEALFSGDYFSKIDLWYSDTFPFRDQLIALNSRMKQLYGVQPVQVSGDVEQGDEIPSAPPAVSSLPEPSLPEPGSSLPEEESSLPEPESSLPEEELPPEKDVEGQATQSLGAVLIVGDSA